MSYALLILFGILVIVGVATIAPKLQVAAPLVLVVVGIGCSFIPGLPPIEVPPSFILALVLPPILYAAAVNVPLVDFRRSLKPIAWLSVVLVIVSAIGSGVLLHWLLPALSLPAAIALGAVISPPDAVAATSIGRRLGLPPRLVTLMEGEGLVNDASALVLLRTALAAAAGAVSLWQIVGDFAYAVAAAILTGFVIGHLTVWVRSKLDNPVLNTTISFAVPFLAYLPAEELNASGVLAVVVAGIVTGHQSARRFSAQDRISERLNWRTVQFVLENGVFLLMGLELQTLLTQVHESHLGIDAAAGFGLLATLALVLIRGAFVVPLIAVLRHDQRVAARRGKSFDSTMKRLKQRTDASERLTSMSESRKTRARLFLRRKRADFDFLSSEGLGWRGGAVLAWAGMRGVVTLAAAQSLPPGIPYRPQLILIAFTVAIATLLAQGMTLPLLIRSLGIVGKDPEADRAELADLVSEVSRVGLAALDNPELKQENGKPFDPEVIDSVRSDSKTIAESVAERANVEGRGPHEQHRVLRRQVLQAERAALLDARSTGAYSSHVIERAQHMLDLEESRLAQLDDD